MLDLALPRLSPIDEAQRAVCRAITSDVMSGPMGPVVAHFGGSADRLLALVDAGRRMLCSMSAQTWWRFLEFECYPVKLVELVSPGFDTVAFSNRFCSTLNCCLDADFSEEAKRMCPTGDLLRACPDMKRALLAWAKKHRVSSRHVERLLALIKQSTSPPHIAQRS